MKTRVQVTLLSLLVWFLATGNAYCLSPKEIMQKVKERNDGTTQYSKIKLSTCRYAIKGRRMGCVETPRVKVMESVRKDFGDREQDSKSVILILEPSGERGIGFLQYDWDDSAKDSDQWMYFSAFGKVKRIISGSDNEPKTGSFFGTEILFEDLEARNIEDYTYKLLGEELYQKQSCWVIESIPTRERARKSNYSKTVSWIDKERFLTLKTILYNRQGRRVKRITNSKAKEINSIWVMQRMLVNNLESKRYTTFELKHTTFDFEVDNSFLTQRTLTDKAFRERGLRKYRAK